ncbi:AI-2E family transporter [Brachybacterium saurashtrense]|uniref:AI-2E family transporter n=1 Tax=Brachybacterium saurashtrense TaxID=556288 RepID=A0A345YLW9_9MICO|nr:AI-2E family transporter [Brachybacterium saurashtrense]AXK44921.1 AI-2E family transporter [Brachybacterium saurashtrense]RRR21605.1 AI-2E family transporter [Brachybacterium saurashtrense]
MAEVYARSGSSAADSRPRVAVILVGAASVVIVLAGMRAISGIVAPVFLALVITVTLHPIRKRLERWRLPGWVNSTLMLLIAYLELLFLAIALFVSASQLAALVPQYSEKLHEARSTLGAVLSAAGMDSMHVDTIMDSLDPGRLLNIIAAILSSSFGMVANLFFLATILLFFAFDTDSTRRGLAFAGRRHFPGVVEALASFTRGTRNYMNVATGFGLIVAVVDGIVLYLLDVPGAFAWAVLAFVTNYIPNIGFVIGLVPPAFIALLDGGTGKMLLVIVLYCVINFVIQSMIQPRIVGDAVGLSATLTFLSLAFWAWLLGPIGALLAVPLSLLARAMFLEVDRNTAWALPLAAGKSGQPVPESEAAREPELCEHEEDERAPGDREGPEVGPRTGSDS